MITPGSVAAYVLIEIAEADPLAVTAALRALPGVQQAHVLLGPTDCVAFVVCPDHAALRDLILAIRAVPGVVKTDSRYVYG
jgi:DNA-binding Lrp family transcriptional regulator